MKKIYQPLPLLALAFCFITGCNSPSKETTETTETMEETTASEATITDTTATATKCHPENTTDHKLCITLEPYGPGIKEHKLIVDVTAPYQAKFSLNKTGERYTDSADNKVYWLYTVTADKDASQNLTSFRDTITVKDSEIESLKDLQVLFNAQNPDGSANRVRRSVVVNRDSGKELPQRQGLSQQGE